MILLTSYDYCKYGTVKNIVTYLMTNVFYAKHGQDNDVVF